MLAVGVGETVAAAVGLVVAQAVVDGDVDGNGHGATPRANSATTAMVMRSGRIVLVGFLEILKKQ